MDRGKLELANSTEMNQQSSSCANAQKSQVFLWEQGNNSWPVIVAKYTFDLVG